MRRTIAVGDTRADEIDHLLLAKNQKSQASMDIRLRDLTDDLRERYEERAAIMEFDGGLSREDAEHLAMQEVVGKKADE